MAITSNFFDTAVIDSNFFIGLTEIGYDKRVLPILKDKKTTSIHCVIPEQLPISDIPRRYRELRRDLPKYIEGLKVNRESKFWEWAADIATRKHFIRAKDDPADIDVFVLARRLEKKGQKVIVVSDDEGVIRACREITEFKGLSAMSSGAFLFTLGALVKDSNIQLLLEQAGDKIYTKFLTYRRKSRKFIDIQSLVNELRDTAQYVKMAATAQAHAQIQTKVVIKEEEKAYDDKSDVDHPQVDNFAGAMEIIQQFREYRQTHNWIGGEKYSYTFQQSFSTILLEAQTSDIYRIMISMLIGELFEFHTWALDMRLKTGGILESMLHLERLMSNMMFMRISNEIWEDLIALQSLLFILNGRDQQALALAQQGIPQENQMSSTQLMSLICAHIAQNMDPDTDEAEVLYNKYVINGKNVDLIGFLESILRFSNTCHLFKQTHLAIRLLQFIVEKTAVKEAVHITEIAQLLFHLSRLDPKSIMTTGVKKQLKKLKINTVDNSQKTIPTAWKKAKNITENDTIRFQGNIVILNKIKPIDKPDEFQVIGFEENTSSVWRFIFPEGYSIMMEKALGFRLKGGTIKKIISKTTTDPANVRGTIFVDDPVFQVNIQANL